MLVVQADRRYVLPATYYVLTTAPLKQCGGNIMEAISYLEHAAAVATQFPACILVNRKHQHHREGQQQLYAELDDTRHTGS